MLLSNLFVLRRCRLRCVHLRPKNVAAIQRMSRRMAGHLSVGGWVGWQAAIVTVRYAIIENVNTQDKAISFCGACYVCLIRTIRCVSVFTWWWWWSVELWISSHITYSIIICTIQLVTWLLHTFVHYTLVTIQPFASTYYTNVCTYIHIYTPLAYSHDMTIVAVAATPLLVTTNEAI